MPDQQASPNFASVHAGRTIHFCCQACVDQFQANPKRYLQNLPDDGGGPVDQSAAELDRSQRPIPPREPLANSLLRRMLLVFAFLESATPYRFLIGYALSVLLVTCIARRRRGKTIAAGRAPTFSDRIIAPFTRPTVLLILLLSGLCAQLLMVRPTNSPDIRPGAVPAASTPLDDATYTPVENVLHYCWPQGFHDLPRGVSNRYYRGNDERSPALFNGGNYRTATFHVSLHTADGALVQPGDKVGDQPLLIRFELIRAPNTTPGFFQATQMAKMVFFRPNPADGIERIRPIKKDWQWLANLPVHMKNQSKLADEDEEIQASQSEFSERRGLWLLFAVADADRPAVSSAVCHMYIQYVLYFRHGKLDPHSRIWMASVYASPKQIGPDAEAQWFSDRPIPEIPDGKNVHDPKLLGTDQPY